MEFAMKKLILLIVIVAAVSGGAYGLKQWKLQKVETARVAQLTQARSPFVKHLKDPQSVQYRNEVFSRDKKTLCGEFNAKNSMGGYVGFKRYIAKDTHYLIEDETYRTWDVEGNIKKPDEDIVYAIGMIERASYSSNAVETSTANSMKDEIFKWFWDANCE
jgi:hypothetical protein